MIADLPVAEPLIRLGCFAGVLALMVLWEILAPRRPQGIGRRVRWPGNLGVVVVDTMILRLLFPTAAVGAALVGEAHGWGLLNQLALPGWLAVLVTILVLDLVIYLQHVLFHAVPGLWRLHRMHHADLEIDVTTGIRFHPGEIVLSMLIKIGVVVALGAPAVGVLLFEVLLNATSMFNHGNVRLPLPLDRALRWLLVTPDMHRVHHSIVPSETNSNFGFNLAWWDRLFGTYRPQPAAGHLGMTIGIETFREPGELRLDRMLAAAAARRCRPLPARPTRRAALRRSAASHRWPGVPLALGSAVFFGASTPFAKLLLGTIDPWLMAGLLYLGAGLGLAIVRGGRLWPGEGRGAPAARGPALAGRRHPGGRHRRAAAADAGPRPHRRRLGLAAAQPREPRHHGPRLGGVPRELSTAGSCSAPSPSSAVRCCSRGRGAASPRAAGRF